MPTGECLGFVARQPRDIFYARLMIGESRPGEEQIAQAVDILADLNTHCVRLGKREPHQGTLGTTRTRASHMKTCRQHTSAWEHEGLERRERALSLIDPVFELGHVLGMNRDGIELLFFSVHGGNFCPNVEECRLDLSDAGEPCLIADGTGNHPKLRIELIESTNGVDS